jgi:predicted O-methyltransferase YrrM
MRTFDEIYAEMNSFTEAHQREDELHWAFDMIRKSGCRIYLEVGSLFGGSWYVLSQAMKPGLTISVDLQNRSSCCAKLQKSRTRLEKLGYEPIAIGGSSQEIPILHSIDSRVLPLPGPVAAFIDGDHSYEGSKSDYFAFRSYVIAKGGLVMFHDARSRQGCAKLWEEIEGSSPFPAKVFSSCKNRHMGIGVLKMEKSDGS